MKAHYKGSLTSMECEVSIPSRGFYLMKDEQTAEVEPGEPIQVSIPSRGFYLMKANNSMLNGDILLCFNP